MKNWLMAETWQFCGIRRMLKSLAKILYISISGLFFNGTFFLYTRINYCEKY